MNKLAHAAIENGVVSIPRMLCECFEEDFIVCTSRLILEDCTKVTSKLSKRENPVIITSIVDLYGSFSAGNSAAAPREKCCMAAHQDVCK